jgi:nucleoside-diphosphate-sugar epimerase
MSLNVLILGCDGFIGSNLTEHILKTQDWNVYGVDLGSGRLTEFLEHPRFHFTQADITLSPGEVDRLIERCDVVLPLVAIATPISYVRHPLRVFELTFEANLRIVRRCVEGQKRVVFPSSSEVYGMSTDAAFEEETTPLVVGPINKHRWIYACSKQLLDRVIHAYGIEQGLRYTIFRPFNWIGPRQDDVLDPREGSSRVLTQFIGNILRRQDLRVVDGGYQRRCFLYIGDALDALTTIIENRNGCADQRIFNIGNPQNEISIRDLADLLISLIASYPGFEDVAKQVTWIDVPSKDYYGTGYQDIPTRTPSIRNAEHYLGWHPKVDLATALRKTLDFCLAQLPSA